MEKGKQIYLHIYGGLPRIYWFLSQSVDDDDNREFKIIFLYVGSDEPN